MLFELTAYATDAAATGAEINPTTAEINPTTAMIAQFLPFIVLILFFWLFIIRPQRKRDKQMREMLAAIKVGDKVTTIGGVVGKIAKIKDDVVTIETGSDKTTLVFERKAIATVEQKISD